MSYHMSSMYGIKRMNIVKLIIQETGTYNQQWKRPYTSGLNAKTFNSIVEKSVSQNGITANSLTGVANQFLHPAATPESHLYIPNGWNERRLRFFMEIQIEDQSNCVISEYVVGYTDYAGMGLSGSLDPNMRFFINGINSTRYMMHTTPLGTQSYQNTIDASHILSNSNYVSIQQGNRSFSMRPEDIFIQMDVAEIQRTDDLGDFCDTQTLVTASPIKSKRTNGIAPVYVSTILDAYVKAKPGQRETEGREDLIKTAIAYSRSDAINDDHFIALLRSKYDGHGDSFTYSDLIGIDNNVVAATIVLPLTNTSRTTLHQTGSTSDWGAADGETVFATCISQSLPGYMLEYCINKIHVRATNRDLGGRITVDVIDVKSFMQNVDITNYIKSLLFKLENELLKDLSFNNQMDFAIDVRCDLLGETWINLSLNSGAFVMYVTPSFCDALMSPVVTNNYDNCIGIASDFNNLLDHITDSSAKISFLDGASFQNNPFGGGFGNI